MAGTCCIHTHLPRCHVPQLPHCTSSSMNQAIFAAIYRWLTLVAVKTKFNYFCEGNILKEILRGQGKAERRRNLLLTQIKATERFYAYSTGINTASVQAALEMLAHHALRLLPSDLHSSLHASMPMPSALSSWHLALCSAWDLSGHAPHPVTGNIFTAEPDEHCKHFSLLQWKYEFKSQKVQATPLV